MPPFVENTIQQRRQYTSMPESVDECAKSIMDDNPDVDESRAFAICNAMQNRGELSVGEDASHDELLQAAARDDPDCPDGQVSTGEDCVAVETVTDAPPSILSDPQHLTLESLDTEPIERVQEDDTTVRYKSLKLLSPGVWADAGSEMATFYPPDGIAALEPDFDDSNHDGPPVNIMHDLDMESFDAHKPSVAGHVDPQTLGTDDDGNLFGDIVLDTTSGAGQFADENLQSTLENEGTVGFGGPSVEIPAEGLQQSHDEQRDMPRVDGGLLSGVALVMDPASKSVSFAREAARRPVALSGSGDNVKVLSRQEGGMRTLQDPEEVREIMERFGFDVGDMDDEEMLDMAEDLHDDLMEKMEGGDDGAEMEDDKDDEDEDDEEKMEMETHDGEMEDEEDDEDEDTEMADGEDVEAMQERVQNLASRLEDLEDAVAQAMTEDDVGSELAAADSVEELDHRLSALEDEPKESKTLADDDGADIDWSKADDGVDYDPATGSMSGR